MCGARPSEHWRGRGLETEPGKEREQRGGGGSEEGRQLFRAWLRGPMPCSPRRRLLLCPVRRGNLQRRHRCVCCACLFGLLGYAGMAASSVQKHSFALAACHQMPKRRSQDSLAAHNLYHTHHRNQSHDYKMCQVQFGSLCGWYVFIGVWCRRRTQRAVV